MGFANMIKSAKDFDFSNRKNVFDAVDFRNDQVYKALNKSRTVADDSARVKFSEESEELKRDWRTYVSMAEEHFQEKRYTTDFFGRVCDILSLSTDERLKGIKNLDVIVNLYVKGYRGKNGVLTGEHSFISLYHYYQVMTAYGLHEALLNEIIGFNPKTGEWA